jgi:hypothetical protein
VPNGIGFRQNLGQIFTIAEIVSQFVTTKFIFGNAPRMKDRRLLIPVRCTTRKLCTDLSGRSHQAPDSELERCFIFRSAGIVPFGGRAIGDIITARPIILMIVAVSRF